MCIYIFVCVNIHTNKHTYTHNLDILVVSMVSKGKVKPLHNFHKNRANI